MTLLAVISFHLSVSPDALSRNILRLFAQRRIEISETKLDQKDTEEDSPHGDKILPHFKFLLLPIFLLGPLVY